MITADVVIEFTGGQSTGKTTLVRALGSYLRPGTHTHVGETSRSLLKSGVIGHLDIDAAPYEQLLINNEYMLRYVEALTCGAPVVIAERSPICCMAYAELLQNPVVAESTRRMHRLLRSLHKNTYVFYVPPVRDIEEDGIRNITSQNSVIEAIYNVTAGISDSVQHLASRRVDDRVIEVLTAISEMGKYRV